MPNRKKADLIIHPVRLRILQVLASQSLTTQEISAAIPNAAIPSLYRHLQILLEGGMVIVTETRPVRGVQEKVYQLAQPTHLNAEDVAGMSQEEHLHYFNIYVAGLLKGYADYLSTSGSELNLSADQTGFTETTFYASYDEMERFHVKLVEAIKELNTLGPGKGRRQRKFAIISHPINGKEKNHESTTS